MARPQRIFRVLGVSVLVAGAVAGVLVGASQRPADDPTANLLLGQSAPTASPTAQPGPSKDPKAIAKAKASAAASDAAAAAKKANDVVNREQAASRSLPRTDYPVPASCKEYTKNRALGCALLLDAGYGLEQMPCLDKMWTKESGWNHKAMNKSSGAYGIPQALPGDKMAKYGADWRTNPVPQIKWGLSYIKNRYQSPCGAWAFWQTHNWY